MKKLLVLGAIVPLIAGGIAFAKDQDKVNLCHETESNSHPFVVQQVDADEVQSHEANGDFLYAGPLDENGHPDPQLGPAWCKNHQPTPPPPPTPTPTPTPVPTPSPTPTPTPNPTPVTPVTPVTDTTAPVPAGFQGK